MQNLGRYLMLGGLALILVGALLYLGSRIGLPLGRLPGDIRIERDGTEFHLPLVSSILISIILTVLVNLLLRIYRK